MQEVIENVASPVTSSDEEGELSVDDLDTSMYIPTPTKLRRVCVKVPIPDKMCFLELKQLESFIEVMNSVRRCITPGCSGALAIKSIGLGGAISITFSCNHCLMHHIPFESSVKCGGTTEVAVAVQVAFLVAGCTHRTYYRALKLALGIDAVTPRVFMSTIVKMYPVVKEMVDEMCEEAKSDMKSMDQAQLGSWSRAVTSADGTWMTRRRHMDITQKVPHLACQ